MDGMILPLLPKTIYSILHDQWELSNFLKYILIGHAALLQVWLSVPDPTQTVPPFEGAGESQFLFLVWVPPPQVALHWAQVLQDPQFPSIKFINILDKRKNCFNVNFMCSNMKQEVWMLWYYNLNINFSLSSLVSFFSFHKNMQFEKGIWTFWETASYWRNRISCEIQFLSFVQKDYLSGLDRVYIKHKHIYKHQSSPKHTHSYINTQTLLKMKSSLKPGLDLNCSFFLA